MEETERLPPAQPGGDHQDALLLGERVMARTFERQVVEMQVRVALLNRFTQLGRTVTMPMA